MSKSGLRAFLYKYFHYKKLYWIINVIVFNLLKLHPFRNDSIWIFGALGGNKYENNTRYLFEYVNKHDENIRCIWLSKNDEEIEKIRSHGFEAYSFYSLRGIYLALKAGVALYTHGLHDFGKIPLVGGAKIISLWHGFSFKQIYNYNYHGINHYLKRFVDMFFSWTYRDYSMVTSNYTKQQTIIEFSVKNPDTVFITGQARNDVLFTDSDIIHNLKESGIDFGRKRIILYMPTYRGKGQDDNTLEIIVSDLIRDSELNHFLESNNFLFVIKLHPSTPSFSIPENDNFKIINYWNISSNQELLALGEMMITDYSGVFVDYALLKRPILFYVPDEYEYTSFSGKLEQEHYIISRLCRATTPAELKKLLESPNNIVALKTNEIFADQTIPDGKSCEMTYNVIMSEILKR